MKLSIVTTVYRSQSYISEFYARMCATAEQVSKDYELIFVNDGSPDDSLKFLIDLATKDNRVKVIDLARNFGHHKAIMTGLEHAQGEQVFLIDIDLEEPPECLQDFIEYKKRNDCDVVFGIQEKRKGNWFEKLSGNIFYALFNYLSFYPVPPNFVTARLMSARYVKSLLQHRERELFLGGLWAITGYTQQPLLIKKGTTSPSTYTLSRKIELFVNCITAFSDRPLVYIFYLGLTIITVSSCSGVFVVFYRLFIGPLQLGWASLIISFWLLGGLIIFCLGVIGIYLAKIFIETKQRPYVIVKDIYGSKGVADGK